MCTPPLLFLDISECSLSLLQTSRVACHIVATTILHSALFLFYSLSSLQCGCFASSSVCVLLQSEYKNCYFPFDGSNQIEVGNFWYFVAQGKNSLKSLWYNAAERWFVCLSVYQDFLSRFDCIYHRNAEGHRVKPFEIYLEYKHKQFS